MQIKLVVKEPFQDYAKGDEIVDPQKVAEILASEQAAHVLKVAVAQTQS